MHVVALERLEMLPLTDAQKQSLLGLRTMLESSDDEQLAELTLTFITWERYLHTNLEDMVASAVHLAHLALSEDEAERLAVRQVMVHRITEVLGC